MPPTAASERTSEHASGVAAVCPFCALLCDDLSLRTAPDQSFTIARHGCRRAATDYARAPLAATPMSDGQAVGFEHALERAARLFKRARQPLFAGLATDVDGMRSVIGLAERCGATLDHVHGETLALMSRILQSRGWYATTLSELRNRADFVLLTGVDLDDRYESLARRCLTPDSALDPERLAARRLVYLGNTPPATDITGLQVIRCRDEDLADVLQVLLALLKGQAVAGRRTGGVATSALTALAADLRGARYGTVVFAPAALPNPRDPHVAALCEMIDELNRSTRAALLALGGDDGGQTALSTCSWLTGYPLRITCGATVDYAPLSNASKPLLAAGVPDSLLWIDAFGRNPDPPAGARLDETVILGARKGRAADAAAVFIPVGTPGLDHAARLVRTDAVVSLALPQQRATALPSVASVLDAIRARL